MADLVITAANVKAGADAVKENGTAGATILAGQVVYKATSGKYLLVDTDLAGAKSPRGIALHGATLDQPLTIQRSGDITIGATLAAGTEYYASNAAGGISIRAEVATEDVVLLGLAKSATVLALNIQISGVTVA